jgi:molybdate transport system permease protein
MSVISMALCLILAFPAFAAENVEVSSDGSSAKIEGLAFGIDDFGRLNKGTNKFFENAYYGYRYPLQDKDAFVLIVKETEDGTSHEDIFMVSDAALERAGINLRHQEDAEALREMILALDRLVANGGTPLADMTITAHHIYKGSELGAEGTAIGGYVYRYAVEVEPDRYYATVTKEGSEDGSGGTLFCVTGHLVPTSEVTIVLAPTGFAAIQKFFTGIDYRPFWVSLRTSAVAMVFVFILGLLAAWYSQRIGDRLKGVLDSIFTIPMVLPPTVCGFLLLVLFGNSTAVGRWLMAHGIELIFSWPAAVIAAVVVSFPLMYRTARGAFEGLDPSLGDAARTLGWSESRVFLKLTMPLAWPSIAAGTVLAFARAMGEFGATLFVAGNYPGVTQTMPIAIYFEWMGGHSNVATFWVFVVIVFSFVVILFVNWYAARTQRYRRQSADEDDGEKEQGDGSRASSLQPLQGEQDS